MRAGGSRRGGQTLRVSGYVGRLQELGYGIESPLYDALVWWSFLPLGGECRCRRKFAEWLDPKPGQKVLSLCCGTGAMERVLLEMEPSLDIAGVDLGPGQIARARRKDPGWRVDYRQGDAAHTGLPSGKFDRVLIVAALHEMPRMLRLAVLTEAGRLCAPGGLILAVEHCRPRSFVSRILRNLVWFAWVPGNPETGTSRDLQQHGLENEMREAGLDIVARYSTTPDWLEGVAARRPV